MLEPTPQPPLTAQQFETWGLDQEKLPNPQEYG